MAASGDATLVIIHPKSEDFARYDDQSEGIVGLFKAFSFADGEAAAVVGEGCIQGNGVVFEDQQALE